jgi:hypothetical protein
MRSWLSGTARALGVSILVPGVLVGVLLGATVGGVGGLRSLRQLVAGPAIPDDRTATVQSHGTRHPTTTLPAIPPGSSLTASGRERQAQLGHAKTESGRRVTQKQGSRKRRSPHTGTSPTPPATEQPQPPTTGSPTPRQHPLAVVRNVGERVRRTVEPLPAVGPTASDAIETVLDIVDPPNRKTGAVLGGRGG